MEKYTVTIANLVENSTREYLTTGQDIFLVHKNVLMHQCMRDEDILKIHNSDGKQVFDLRKGFFRK